MVGKNRNKQQLNISNDDNGRTTNNISRKSKIRYLLVRGENYEKQMSTLIQSISLYAKRNGKLRDAGDIIAEKLNQISQTEILNPSSKRTVQELSKIFRLIQDHRDSEILYLEDKLLPLYSEYGETLQKQREELRSNTNKMLDSNRSLNWIRSTSTSTNQRLTASKRRSQSMERLDKTINKNNDKKVEKFLQKSIQQYEIKKNIVFKKLLLKLILTELRFTMKSFNNLTYIYKHILDEMNPTKDLKYFNEFFQFKNQRSNQIFDNGLDSDEENEDDDIDEDDDDDDSGNDEDSDDDDHHQDSEQSDDNIVVSNQKSSSKSGKSRSDNDEDDDDNDDDKRLVKKSGQNKKNRSSVLKRFNSTPEISINQKKNFLKSNDKTSITANKDDNKKKIQSFGRSIKNRLPQSKPLSTKNDKKINHDNPDDDGSELTDDNSGDDDNDDDDSDSDSNSMMESNSTNRTEINNNNKMMMRKKV